jgi:RNA polymerase sigma-70 factor (ECF subfamily)
MTPPNTDEEDRQAMAQLAAGQDVALNDLMARHAERLFHYLVRVVQNETEAGDLAEECFVRVYQHRARFNPRHKFTSWLYTIATNLARDSQRYRARHPNLSLEAEHPHTGQGFRETLPETGLTPGEAMESADRAELVRRAVAALPEELRLPLVLAVYEGKSQAEIAQILECSPKAVEMRIYRARQELRPRLATLLA